MIPPARNEDSMYRNCMLAAVCVLLTAALARGQETTTGSIAGRVVDAQDLALPGAAVTVVTPQGRKTSSPMRRADSSRRS